MAWLVAHRQVLNVVAAAHIRERLIWQESVLLEAHGWSGALSATTRAVEPRKQNLGQEQHGRMEQVYMTAAD